MPLGLGMSVWVAALGCLDCLRRQAAVRGRTAVCADVATARPVEGTGRALVAKATMVKPSAEPASTTAARSRARPVRMLELVNAS